MTETTTEAKTEDTTEKVHDPIHGTTYLRARGRQPVGLHGARGRRHLPEHFHPSLEERWETLEGKARVKLDGTWRDLVPEDGPVVVAPNVKHELKNESGREARLRTEVIPGGRLESSSPRARAPRARASTTAVTCRRASAARVAGRVRAPVPRRDRDDVAAARGSARRAASTHQIRALEVHSRAWSR